MPPKAAKAINLHDRVKGVAHACKNLIGIVTEVLVNEKGRRMFKIRWENGEEVAYFMNSIELLNPPVAVANAEAPNNNLAPAGGEGAQGNNAAAVAADANSDGDEENDDDEDGNGDGEYDGSDSEIDRYE
jgi:hypothetical protein